MSAMGKSRLGTRMINFVFFAFCIVFPGGILTGSAIFDFNPVYGEKTITATATGGGSINPSGAVTPVDGNSPYQIQVLAMGPGSQLGRGGSINPGGPAGIFYVFEGHNQTFTITPDPGYQDAELWVDGTNRGSGYTTWTFTNVVGDHTIEAVFGCSPDFNGVGYRRIDGDQYQHYAGYSVAGLGDLNGDGKSEYIIGRPGSESGPLTDAGSAIVYNGNDGSVLYWHNGTAANDWFGWSVASAGDINGDGTPDYMVGAPYSNYNGTPVGAGYADVYSGTNGARLYRMYGDQTNHNSGWSVAGVGDVNGDGKGDFIIGRPGSESGPLVDAGSALVYSGADGSVLYWYNGEASGDKLGTSVAGVGDVNGDGRPDFAIGAPYADPGGATDAGSVYVCSGSTGARLYKINGDQLNHWSGMAIAGVGDVNQDGKADFIIGRPGSESGPLVDAGSALVYSGADGGVYGWINGEQSGDFYGSAVAGIGDANNDGLPDYVVGAPYADRNCTFSPCVGAAYVVSGYNGVVLHRYSGVYGGAFCSDGDRFGFSVAGAGDVNGDGGADIIIGAPWAENSQPNPSDAGKAYIYLGVSQNPGDANFDGSLTASDVIYTINYIFKGGTPPTQKNRADVNADCKITTSDVIYLINYIFKSGVAPRWGCVGP